MKNIVGVLFAIVCSVTVFASRVSAQSFARSGDTIVVNQDETIDHDYFAAGQSVEIIGTVNGDTYIAGSSVVVSGVVNGDVLVAGKDIVITGKVTGDVRAVGETIRITGFVGGNMTTGSATLILEKGATLKGSLVGGAETMTLSAPVGKSITAGVKTLTVSNKVGGDLAYWSMSDATLSKEATISGTVTRHDLPQPERQVPDKSRVAAGLAGFSVLGGISLFIVGALVLKLFPVYSKEVTAHMRNNPWGSLGRGIVYAIAIPVILIVMMVTIVGIPLSLVGFVLYGLASGVSKIISATFIGESAVNLFSIKSNAYGHLAIGIIVSAIMGMIPIFGWLALTAIYCIAFANLINHQRELHKTLRIKKLV